jgi:DNA replication protein DnaC
VAAANIPDDYRNVTLTNSPASEGQPVIYGRLAEYIKTFTRQFENGRPPIKSLYLYSDEPGTGKTTTAAALANEYLNVHYIGSLLRNRQALERPVYFLDVNEWQTEYNAFNRPRVPDSVAMPAAERYYDAMTAAQTARFAVFDDIGVRDATDAFRSDLHTIINARITNGLPSIYTSNIPMRPTELCLVDRLEKLFDRRLADRIREQTLQYMFGGESKRGVR